MITSKKTHSGQDGPYKDSYFSWEILTDEPEEKVLDYCMKDLYKSSYELPEESVWRKNIRTGGERDGDYGYYFGGYYSFKKLPDIDGLSAYVFTYTRPFVD